ncbi:transposase [Candidatus Gottesmanbacteria bacterium]|nr:transposase [Candidatus Gottesmanbacteria bacterium]
MKYISRFPTKVKLLLELEYPLIDQLLPRKGFIGGRIGYSKPLVFKWLLVKKVTNWAYRTITELSGISHQTFVRRNQDFLAHQVYQQFFQHLVKTAVNHGFIRGVKVALDSSFVSTYSSKRELGSDGWNGFKQSFGFKLHALIDTETRFPIALIITNGLAADCTLAIPLLKKAKRYLKKKGYVLADKGYDDSDIINWIVKMLHFKAGIPMRKKSRLAKGKKNRYGNLLNWRMKAVGRTFKKSIYKFRTEVERFFSQIKHTYHLGKEYCRGIEAFTKNVYLALISFCLTKLYGVGMRSF